ncbi:hypothetical protein [Achromobacter phage Motura]|uniref:Uncharacterized protein n=1 Tax=Achromobacter phage Motura TaxID=2591403 RepID=A0A514CT21_9CAUD|nr:hypothetical protein H1O15_gp157 [Achromobacter phage Motura]QDH83631.1 hypothetical protein [Achromobacter phage Motura]
MELPKFRYVEDVIKYLQKMKSDLRESNQVLNQQVKLLAKLARPTEFTIKALSTKTVLATLDQKAKTDRPLSAALETFKISSPGGSDKKKLQNLKRKIDPNAEKVIVPNLKKLKDQYSILADLHQKWQALESIETQMGMQFADSSQTEKARNEIAFIKQAIQQQMQTAFSFLNEVASAHVPKQFKQYVDALAAEVSEHVVHSDAHSFLYINVSPKGSITFTNYLMIQEAMNADGEVAKTLYITVQWVMGSADEDASVKVYLTHDFELPEQLQNSGSGIEVTNVQQAVKAIANLLDLENFSSSLGVIPLALQLKVDPSAIKRSDFSYRDYLDSVTVSDTGLVFKTRKNAGVNKESAIKMAAQLNQEIKEMLQSKKNAKMRAKIEKAGEQYVISFSLDSTAGGITLNLYDIEFMRDKFKLTDNQLRKIALIMQGKVK